MRRSEVNTWVGWNRLEWVFLKKNNIVSKQINLDEYIYVIVITYIIKII